MKFKKNQTVRVQRRNSVPMMGKIIHVEPSAGRGEWYTVRSLDKSRDMKVRACNLSAG